MLSSMYRQPRKEIVCSFEPSYMRVASKQVAEKGVIRVVSQVEKFDFSAQNKQFTMRDFSLQNIVALGNDSLLKPVSMAAQNLDGVITKVNAVTDEISQQTIPQE